MKVLFIGKGEYVDYLSDMVFHGLHTLLGDEFYHSHPYGYMFSDFPKDPLRAMWGRGFTVYRLLDPATRNVPDDIPGRIAAHYFDRIIYGEFARCSDYIDLVLEHYPIGHVAFIDGEDHTDLHHPQLDMTQFRFRLYFKRELRNEHARPGVFPISFSIPAERIVGEIPEKIQTLSPIIPGASYSFNEEEPYYQQYRNAAFAMTWQKGGWDCLRHLEIMANACVPVFKTINQCPPLTMTSYPKGLFVEAIQVYNGYEAGSSAYRILLDRLMSHLWQYLTTEALASYVMSILRR